MRLANFGSVAEKPSPFEPFLPLLPTPPGVPFLNLGHSPEPTRHQKYPIYPSPKMVLGILGWKPLTLEYIARHYNGGGDGNYLGKLQCCYKLVQERAAHK